LSTMGEILFQDAKAQCVASFRLNDYIVHIVTSQDRTTTLYHPLCEPQILQVTCKSYENVCSSGTQIMIEDTNETIDECKFCLIDADGTVTYYEPNKLVKVDNRLDRPHYQSIRYDGHFIILCTGFKPIYGLYGFQRFKPINYECKLDEGKLVFMHHIRRYGYPKRNPSVNFNDQTDSLEVTLKSGKMYTYDNQYVNICDLGVNHLIAIKRHHNGYQTEYVNLKPSLRSQLIGRCDLVSHPKFITIPQHLKDEALQFQ